MRSRLAWLALWSSVLSAAAQATACGTSAVDVQACKDIEDARCVAAANAPVCGIDLSQPLHNDNNAATACIRFYDTQCLHGLATSTAPSSSQVTACVAAIKAGGNTAATGDVSGCDVVKLPQNDPACAFLIPPPPAPVPDAGTADADAASEGG